MDSGADKIKIIRAKDEVTNIKIAFAFFGAKRSLLFITINTKTEIGLVNRIRFRFWLVRFTSRPGWVYDSIKIQSGFKRSYKSSCVLVIYVTLLILPIEFYCLISICNKCRKEFSSKRIRWCFPYAAEHFRGTSILFIIRFVNIWQARRFIGKSQLRKPKSPWYWLLVAWLMCSYVYQCVFMTVLCAC